MPDNPQVGDTNTTAETPVQGPPPPRRGPGHRAADARDTAAEMAARAHEISLEAGSKMAGAMREVIGAAAGLSAFAIESARDLVHYMVRRGQMGQEEAEQLIAVAEAAYIAKHGSLPKPEPKAPPAKPVPLGSTAKDQAASAASRGLPKPEFAPIRVEPKVELKAEAKSETSVEPEPKPEPKPAPKAEVKAEPAHKAASKPEPSKSEPAKPVHKPAHVPVKAAAKAPAKAAPKAAAKPAAKAPAKHAAKAPVKAAAKPASKAKKPAGKKK